MTNLNRPLTNDYEPDEISKEIFEAWEATEAYLASCSSGFPLS